tara:strand:- start:288 stop:482 length:195 start_codon:yes stop_codon:yes gene_type:complete
MDSKEKQTSTTDDRGDLDLTKIIEVQQKEMRDLVKDNQLLIEEIDRLRSQIERLKNLITNNGVV